MDGVRFPKRFARKSKIAEHSVGLYHFAAGVMTEEDLKTLRLELIEYNLFIPKDVRDDLSQFRIIKRKDTASRVDLFLIDCLFPGNPEIQDFRQDVGSRLEDEPYPAVMVPESVTLIKGNDMTNIVIENDRYIIPVTRSSSQDNTHALQEETQPGIVRDTPQSNQPEQNQQSLAGPPQTEPPSTALPRQQPPSMESLRAGLRQEQWIEPSPAGPLPRTLSQQRPTLEESLLATMQSEPSTRALPVTRSPGPQPWPGNGPQSQMFTGQAPMNPRFSSHLLSNDHIYRRVSNPNSLGSFSDSTNAMRPKGPLQRPLDLEQRSHQRSMTSEQQMNDEQTSRARGVDDVQNPTHKRARVRDHNVRLTDSDQQSRQVGTALGQQTNDRHDHAIHSIDPIRVAIGNISYVTARIHKLLEERGDSMGGMEEESDKLDDVLAYLTKLHRDLDATSRS